MLSDVTLKTIAVILIVLYATSPVLAILLYALRYRLRKWLWDASHTKINLQWTGRRAIPANGALWLSANIPAELRGAKIVSAYAYWAAEHDCPSDTEVRVAIGGAEITIPDSFRPETDWQLCGEADLTDWFSGLTVGKEASISVSDPIDEDSGILVEAGIALTVECGFLKRVPDYFTPRAPVYTADPKKLAEKRRVK